MWHDAAASGTPNFSRRERLSGSSLTVASTPRSARYPTQPRQQPQPGSRHTSIDSPPSAFEVAVPPPGRATSVTAESPAPPPHAASPTATIPPNAARKSVRRSRIETSVLALNLSTFGKLPHSVAYCSERLGGDVGSGIRRPTRGTPTSPGVLDNCPKCTYLHRYEGEASGSRALHCAVR